MSIDAIRRLVDLAELIELDGVEEQANLKHAIAAVESLLSHAEVVEIPQGESCWGCVFLREEDQENCRNPHKVDGKGYPIRERRPKWCRSRYGEKEEAR